MTTNWSSHEPSSTACTTSCTCWRAPWRTSNEIWRHLAGERSPGSPTPWTGCSRPPGPCGTARSRRLPEQSWRSGPIPTFDQNAHNLRYVNSDPIRVDRSIRMGQDGRSPETRRSPCSLTERRVRPEVQGLPRHLVEAPGSQWADRSHHRVGREVVHAVRESNEASNSPPTVGRSASAQRSASDAA